MKLSNDPDYEPKKNRVLELYDIAEGKAEPSRGDPTVIFSMDEFGPLNLLPRPGKQWAPVIARNSKGSVASPRRRRRRATYTRTKGVRHLFAALDMNQDKLYGHIKTNKCRTTFLAFCRYLRSLYRPACAWPSCWITTARTCPPGKTTASASGRQPITSNWLTCPPTHLSSIASNATSGPCATSP